MLPFANIGGNVDQDYFVDGVTESLTTDLSRMPGMLVIGRNTAFAYKGKSSDLKQIGRQLNIRYALEGSIQRGGGDQMRVNVQLIDAGTGNHLWAERFDKPVADLFDMQDEIVARLANSLNTQLITAEARRAERAPSPNSMDHYFQGIAWFNKGFAPDNLSRAKNYFERALSLDASNVEALVGIAWTNCVFAHIHTSDDRLAHLAAGGAASQPGPLPSRLSIRWGICASASPTFSTIAPHKASRNANGRWRLTEILLLPMPTLAWPNGS